MSPVPVHHHPLRFSLPRRRAFAALLLTLGVGGCALPLTHPGAALEVPENWAEAGAAANAATIDGEWWRGYGSAELEVLIDAALAGSPDLAATAERVLQAEIAVRAAGGALFTGIDRNLRSQVNESPRAGVSTRAEGSSATGAGN